MGDETGERDDEPKKPDEPKPAIKPCTCDIQVLLWAHGCTCGAIESERA